MSMSSDQVPTGIARENRALRLHPEHLTFAKLPPGSELPDWAKDVRPLSTVAWSAEETSVLAPVRVVPDDIDRFGPWCAFEVEGHIDFLLTGVLNGIITPLAASHIAVTTLSTYNTDWILVPADQADAAVNVWRYHGYTVNVLADSQTSTDGPTGHTA
ncbi:ACT domain-containing protein [Mobilicoccus caccae]|uniref:CASTOR ACT domain-containing protein n=1 Tax=Mobilicoccus caccae TaxID=1859295 RepID=A0ABQ6IQ05_9MICO|nr:ACT domain-containing protein [Mobilicoccus caccae]GMA39998.1 hypothetical protein GCM10025883_20430 [Mobilicoccus caccae]